MTGRYTTLKSGLMMLLAGIVTVGPAYSQTESKKPVKLEYNYPAEGIKYLMAGKIIQTMDVMGQSMQVNILSSLGCVIRSSGKTAGNLNLEIKIDTLGQKTDSPQGITGGAVTDVIGKTFHMTISPQGKEKDLLEAAKISYNIEGSGPSDLSQAFSDYFPDLPEKAVSPGYKWTTTDTISSKTQTMSLLMIVKAENSFEGYQQSAGAECARITSVLSGTREVKTTSQGMDVKMNGPFTGSGTFLFAPSLGYFLRQDVATKMSGTIDITTPDAMTFPVVMDMTTVNEVVK